MYNVSHKPLSISILSETICLRTSTKSHSTVAAETTHTHSANAAARRTKGRERRRRVARLAHGSPSSLDAESSLPPRAPPPPTKASNSRRLRIFFPTRSGTAACTALSMSRESLPHHHFTPLDTLSLSGPTRVIHTTLDYRVNVIYCKY